MISRNVLACSTCGATTTTRTAIGHGKYQEFAFPCHRCGIEIRFGMTLNQEKASFEYSKIENATWCMFDESAPTHTFDGESLIPIRGDHFSPFTATVFLAQDPDIFLRSQSIRMHASREIWPIIEKMHTHYDRAQWDFFEKEVRELGFTGDLLTDLDRLEALVWTTQLYGKLFANAAPQPAVLVKSRVELAEKASAVEVANVIATFKAKGRQRSLNAELRHIRQQWVQFIPLLLPMYTVYYWDDATHSLNDYTIAQKRFVELKPFYVDCFETLSRISCIAAALEGVIRLSLPVVPTKKGTMSIDDFETMANGSKPDVLKNLPIADLFVPFIDSHLRNGMGHNAARYNVTTDAVEYVNESKTGRNSYSLPYVQFCEKVMRIYGQLEIVAAYADWLLLRSQ